MAHLTWNFSQDSEAPKRPVILIVHNFGGAGDNFHKHVALLNLLGFDAITFDLSWHGHSSKKIFFKKLRAQWAYEINGVLKTIIQKRTVIPFSFSGLGACTLDAASELLTKNPETSASIKALIFDSGPFDEQEECIKNMLELHFKIKNALLRKTAARLLIFGWGFHNNKKTQESFKKITLISPQIPMLSLIGAKDRIVPQKYIEKCFQKEPQKNLTQVVFLSGGHLTSYKEEPIKYKETLHSFLASF